MFFILDYDRFVVKHSGTQTGGVMAARQILVL